MASNAQSRRAAKPSFTHSPLPELPDSIRLIKISIEAGIIETSSQGTSESHHRGFSPLDGIVCSMDVFDLKTAPPYDALSYTWENPLGVFNDQQHADATDEIFSQKVSIICNGNVLKVGANLFDALLLLRGGLRAGGSLEQIQSGLFLAEYIWIDAICIDQSNLCAQNEQMRLRDKIYRQAEKAIVWLGDEDNSLPDVVKIVCTIGSSGPSLIRNSDNFISSRHLAARDYSSQGLPSFRTSEWLSVFTFYSRTWFHRIWKLQEVILAKYAVILCGTYYFQWNYLAMTADFLSRSGWASDIVGEATKYYEFKKNKSLFNTPKFVSITRCELGLPSYLTAVAGAQAPDLLSLLHRFRSAGCSEPKDKLYAIRGLLEGGPNADLIEKITMDYKVPDWQIYLETAWAILTSDNNLNLLSHAAQSDMEGVENLPSWVPDWSVAESNSVIRDRTSTDEFGNETVLWHASARLRWKRQGTQGSRILAVQGNCVGVVTNVVETAEIVKNLGQIYRVFHRIRRMYSATGIRLTSDGDSTDPDMQVPTGTSRPPQSRFEALWRTLIMDRWKGLYPAPQEAGHAFARTVIFGHLYLPLQENPFAAFETTARNWEILKTLSDDEKECTNLIELYQAAWGDLPEIEIGESADPTEIEHPTKFLPNFEGTMYSGNWQEFSDAVIEDIDGYFSTWRVSQSARPLVITDTGLLGLGHGASKQGDEVWVLAGACVPFLLRKVTNGTHQVVGEAYIHGIMNGEAVVGTKSLQDVILA